MPPGGRCCEAGAGAREGHVCHARDSWEHCQDVEQDIDLAGWPLSLGLIGAWYCVGTGGLAELGDGGDQAFHPIWWFSLTEMLSLPAGQVPLQHGLAMTPAMGHPPLPRGTLPCHGALPAVMEPQLGLFARSSWVRLVSC